MYDNLITKPSLLWYSRLFGNTYSEVKTSLVKLFPFLEWWARPAVFWIHSMVLGKVLNYAGVIGSFTFAASSMCAQVSVLEHKKIYCANEIFPLKDSWLGDVFGWAYLSELFLSPVATDILDLGYRWIEGFLGSGWSVWSLYYYSL